MSKTKKICPECGSKNIIPIVYGFPGSELMEEEYEGKIKLGGCCISPGIPKYYCKDCQHEFGRYNEDSEFFL